jgi:lipopolysaccharide export system protein LptA
MTVILSGETAKVISGKNSISGSKITLNRKSGQVKVEGSKNKRIKAEFYTKDKASDAFKIEKSEE